MEIFNKECHNNQYTIIHLPEKQWQHYEIPTGKHGFSGRLYGSLSPETCAWGVVAGKKLIAAIETVPDAVSNCLCIQMIWVDMDFRKQGIGHRLMKVAKEQAMIERRRAVVLNVQGCHADLTDFLRHKGFMLVGDNLSLYSPDKEEQIAVFEWRLERRQRLSRIDVEIREERPEDWYEVEWMTQRTFWNKYQKGGDEHYLVHKLRSAKEYLPGISRIALKDGEVVGAIFYSLAYVQDGDRHHDVLTFGPLCVKAEWRGCGIGEMLLHETMKLAAGAGYPGIIILGEPDYYPRIGFRTCDKFDITTEDGKNFDAFMGIELIPGGMEDIRGKFYLSPVFTDIPPEEVSEYNKLFPPLERQYFPMQWD